MSDSRLDIRSRSPGTVHTDDPACRLAWCREGWYVDIEHPNPGGPGGVIVTRYCHLLTRPAVVEGQHVVAGHVIGVSGSSGHSSGPHLHYEVHLGDHSPATAVDPVVFMAGVCAPLGRFTTTTTPPPCELPPGT
ncbi:hypothetical protein Pa4123_89910 [Phytohabitans aurantiacus]|uniref:M23ase beta-sheet core domain-containing protein n=1 Tax=Phytohabitans aurantiacus TaxID=3016789 RepID=A0ABQ5RBZ3_9ACTN|nr:peptidoglycan DD-metalloendopeptidase family protein [Phytohabitans aurantiacus]GLI03712.1 hypothetical protein Pa4123_89910 [Phytohabitans aurantiacus]